jgi:hypothetical protein
LQHSGEKHLEASRSTHRAIFLNDGLSCVCQARHTCLLEKVSLATVQPKVGILSEEVHSARVCSLASEDIEQYLAGAWGSSHGVLCNLLQSEKPFSMQLKQRLVGGKPDIEAALQTPQIQTDCLIQFM